MTTHEVLVAARNIIDRRGYNWWEYDANGYDGDCPLCPEGAIDAVPHDMPRGLKTMNAAKQAVIAQFPPAEPEWTSDLSIRFSWERNSAREGCEFTKDEVLVFFDKAIAATAPAPDLDFLKDPADAQTA